MEEEFGRFKCIECGDVSVPMKGMACLDCASRLVNLWKERVNAPKKKVKKK